MLTQTEGAPITDRRPQRFALLDGLRGLAALSVACFHVGATGKPTLTEVAPWLLALPIRHGDLGVPVFFVLSGFAIAWSVRDVRMHGVTLGRFLLRRSLRLDPPYWVAIGVTVAVSQMATILVHQSSAPLPSWSVIGAHLIYAADVLRIPKLNEAFWTLFLEFQFYCVFASLLMLGEVGGYRQEALTARLVFGCLFLLSLVEPMLHWAVQMPGLFIGTWYSFFLGVCLAWFQAGRLRTPWLVSAMIAVGSYAALRQERFPFAVLATASLIFAACRKGSLSSWLSSTVPQYFGRISYSLYLIHGPVGQRLTNLASRMGVSPAFAALAGLAGSVIAAHLLWRFVEVPSTRWSRTIKLTDDRHRLEKSATLARE